MNLTRASLDSSHFNGNRVALATLIFYRLFFSVLSGYGTTNYEANRRCSPPTILLSLRSDCFAFACMDGLFEQLRHFRPTISTDYTLTYKIHSHPTIISTCPDRLHRHWLWLGGHSHSGGRQNGMCCHPWDRDCTVGCRCWDEPWWHLWSDRGLCSCHDRSPCWFRLRCTWLCHGGRRLQCLQSIPGGFLPSLLQLGRT